MDTATHTWTIYIALISCMFATGVSTPTSPFQGNLTCSNTGVITGVLKDAYKDYKVGLAVCENSGNITTTLQNRSLSTGKCSVENKITLYLYNGPHRGNSGNLYKNQSNNFLIVELQCNYHGLSHGTGLFHVSTNFTNSHGTIATEPVEIETNVEMSVFSNGSLVQPDETIKLGGSYTLRITGPAELYLQVVSCTASKNDACNEDCLAIYDNFHANSTYAVLTDFSGKQHTTEATLSGFRFIDSDTVYLKCNVNLCMLPNCTPTKRKRPNAAKSKEVSVATSFKVRSETSETNGSRGCNVVWERLVTCVVFTLLFKTVM